MIWEFEKGCNLKLGNLNFPAGFGSARMTLSCAEAKGGFLRGFGFSCAKLEMWQPAAEKFTIPTKDL
jgi:hypothetical protein